MEQKVPNRPTPAEVLSEWALPDIVEQTSATGPVEAFRLFMTYAERALHHRFESELNHALTWDAINAGEIRRIVPEPVEGATWQRGAYLHTPKEVEERITNTVNTALRERLLPLLPAIRAYVSRRPNDPATVNRLAWMAEQIEEIPGEIEGRVLWTSREQPEGFYMPRKFEPMAWKELHDGLLAIVDETAATNAAPAHTEDTSAPVTPVARIEWKGTVQVLAWLLRELAEKGWIEAPRHRSTTTRYRAGDIIARRYAEAMAPHFVVNVTTLERELKPEGASVPAQDVEEFRIPHRPE